MAAENTKLDISQQVAQLNKVSRATLRIFIYINKKGYLQLEGPSNLNSDLKAELKKMGIEFLGPEHAVARSEDVVDCYSRNAISNESMQQALNALKSIIENKDEINELDKNIQEFCAIVKSINNRTAKSEPSIQVNIVNNLIQITASADRADVLEKQGLYPVARKLMDSHGVILMVDPKYLPEMMLRLETFFCLKQDKAPSVCTANPQTVFLSQVLRTPGRSNL